MDPTISRTPLVPRPGLDDTRRGDDSPPQAKRVRQESPSGLEPRSKTSPEDDTGTPLRNALIQRDKPRVTQLFAQEAAGRPLVDVWRDAAKNGRTDTLLAAIVLHPRVPTRRMLTAAPRDDNALNGEYHRLLSTGEPELVSLAKEMPYYSEKPGRVNTENLNGQVPFTDPPPAVEPNIFCRHLAIAWLFDIETTGKPDYVAFNDRNKLPLVVTKELEGLLVTLQNHAPGAQIQPIDRWGRFVAEQFESLAGAGGTKRLLVYSSQHAMGAELKVKPGPLGPRYVLNFYDPNVTAAHRRAASDSTTSFETLQLKDFLRGTAALPAYFRDEGSVLTVPVPRRSELLALQQNATPLEPDRRITGPLRQLDAGLLLHLARGGYTGTLHDLKPQMLALAQKEPQKMHRFMLGGEAAEVTPLYLAMQGGNPHTVHALGDIILALPADDETRTKMLAAQRQQGACGLVMAMQDGAAPVVRAYGAMLAASRLPPKLQRDLLSARHPFTRHIASVTAAVNGRLDSLREYLHAVATNPSFTPKDRFELLAIRGTGGRPALQIAAMYGDAACLRELMDWTLASDLSTDHKRKLLLGQDDRRVGALEGMVELNKPENMTAYVQAVLESNVRDTLKVQVLQGHAAPGKLRAAAQRHAFNEAWQAYATAIKASQLSPQAKATLLQDAKQTGR